MGKKSKIYDHPLRFLGDDVHAIEINERSQEMCAVQGPFRDLDVSIGGAYLSTPEFPCVKCTGLALIWVEFMRGKWVCEQCGRNRTRDVHTTLWIVLGP